MSHKLQNEMIDKLFDAILTLIASLSQRYEVAGMLRDKKTYLDISEKTGASTATISRVNRSLNYGNDGYQTVWRHLEEQQKKNRQENGKS